MPENIAKIFEPSSIAIIGASETPGKASERRTRSLIESEFAGNLYLVNPNRDQVFGRKAYASVKDVPEEVDLVMISLPTQHIETAIRESCEQGAKAAIIINAALGDTHEERDKAHKKLLAIAEPYGTRIVGPNCSGIFSSDAKINLLGIPNIAHGKISVIAQSGNVIDSLTYYARKRDLGFRRILSAGNAINVDFHEVLYYLGDDPGTNVIALYVESVRHGKKLLEAARHVIQDKPIVAIKVGSTSAGLRAAFSHTGALSADDAIVDALFHQAGIQRVYNIDEMFDVVEAFSRCPLPKGSRVGILSEGGGDNAIAADNAEKVGLTVPVFSNELQESLKPFLLEDMPASNPVDYGGTAEENPDMIAQCVKSCAQSTEVDSIYITGFFGGFREIIAAEVAKKEEEAAKKLVGIVDKYKVPVVVHTSFARSNYLSMQILKKGGIPVYESSHRAAHVLKLLDDHRKRKSLVSNSHPVVRSEPRPTRCPEIFDYVRSQGRGVLLETEARDVLEQYDIPVAPSHLAQTQAEAVEAAEELGLPVALKVVSHKIIHKSDIGGVRLNLNKKEEVKRAYREVMDNATREVDKRDILGILVSPMAPRGQECILGMVRDPGFGPVLMFGLGGIFVEVLKDVTFRATPLYDQDVDEMIRKVKSSRLLEGYRGSPPGDIDALKETIVKLSRLVRDNHEISELDINPLRVLNDGVVALDARIILSNHCLMV